MSRAVAKDNIKAMEAGEIFKKVTQYMITTIFKKRLATPNLAKNHALTAFNNTKARLF